MVVVHRQDAGETTPMITETLPTETKVIAAEAGHCRCSQCGVIKPLTEFHARKDSKSGRRTDCRKCRYERNRYYYSTDQGKKIVSEQSKRRWKRNKLVVAARNLVNSLILRGKISKEPCKICGSSSSQVHHPNYAEPLRIEWLCHQHHMEVHGKRSNS